MNRKRRKTLEEPKGTGYVHLQGKSIARVSYWLRVEQEVHIVDSLAGSSEEVEGLTSAAGILRVQEGEQNLDGKEGLSLLMEDGRQADFIVTRHVFSTGVLNIKVSGDFRKT